MNKKTDTPTPLSEYEYTLLWMSVRYACRRMSTKGNCREMVAPHQ